MGYSSGTPRCPDCPWSEFLTSLRSETLQATWAREEGLCWVRHSSGTAYWRFCLRCHMHRWPHDLRTNNRHSKPAPPFLAYTNRSTRRLETGDVFWLTSPKPESRDAVDRCDWLDDERRVRRRVEASVLARDPGLSLLPQNVTRSVPAIDCQRYLWWRTSLRFGKMYSSDVPDVPLPGLDCCSDPNGARCQRLFAGCEVQCMATLPETQLPTRVLADEVSGRAFTLVCKPCKAELWAGNAFNVGDLRGRVRAHRVSFGPEPEHLVFPYDWNGHTTKLPTAKPAYSEGGHRCQRLLESSQQCREENAARLYLQKVCVLDEQRCNQVSTTLLCQPCHAQLSAGSTFRLSDHEAWVAFHLPGFSDVDWRATWIEGLDMGFRRQPTTTPRLEQRQILRSWACLTPRLLM